MLITVGETAIHILVALPERESVWGAVLCSGPVDVTAKTSRGERVRTSIVAEAGDDRLIALDSIDRESACVPIDKSTFDRRHTADEGHPHLIIAIRSHRAETATVHVTFATPEYYKFVTGDDIVPTDASDAFDGRRLP
ncbi:hypothetical protein IVA88_24975 [Bradyrhizobium sp. 149]|uniref:hypothetical protein n=1 Tax=Bradyrhizobium sp. 149 TaxID=2782624 RepID=UPI001FF9D59D|nr:hypothetical protein [Bradyrhizobium sp. 149]MCK1654674.1 hypothetical protein [Bradyrhizobium sp. 149]